MNEIWKRFNESRYSTFDLPMLTLHVEWSYSLIIPLAAVAFAMIVFADALKAVLT